MPGARVGRGAATGLAILTCSGGDSGLGADEAGRRGLPLPPLSPATAERLAPLLPSAATVANPLDYTAMIWGERERVAGIVRRGRRGPGDRPAAAVLRRARRDGRRAARELGRGPRRPRGRRGRCAAPRRSSPRRCPSCCRTTRRPPSWSAACRRSQGCGRRSRAQRRCANHPATRRDCARSPTRSRRWRAARLARRGRGEGAAGGGGRRGPRRPRGCRRRRRGGGRARARRPGRAQGHLPALQHKSEAGALALGVVGDDAVRAAHERVSAAGGGAAGAGRGDGRAGRRAGRRRAPRRGRARAGRRARRGLDRAARRRRRSCRCRPSPARVEAALRSLRGAGLLTGARGALPGRPRRARPRWPRGPATSCSPTA